MLVFSRIVSALKLLKSEPHLIALVMIGVVLGVVVLAVVAGGALAPSVFSTIFFALVIILAVVVVVAIGYISLTPKISKGKTDHGMEDVTNRYSVGRPLAR